MTFSLRQRLLGLTILAVIACAGALVAVTGLARTSEAARAERSEALAQAEVVRILAHTPDPLAMVGTQDPEGRGRGRGERRSPRGPSGQVGPRGEEEESRGVMTPEIMAVRAEAIREARADHAMRSAEGDAGNIRPFRNQGNGMRLEFRVVVVAAPRPDGGVVWASAFLPKSADGGWRLGVGILAGASVLLVLVSLQALTALQRGARSLNTSLVSLATDLSAPVERPAVAELAVVADGITSLAHALQRAEVERSQLRSELDARERLAALGRVVAGVSHEVRNPLASIKLKVDLAVMELPPSAKQLSDDLHEVGAEIARLDRLVSDLLVIAGRRAVVRVETSLASLAASRCELLRPVAASRQIALQVMGEATLALDRDAVTRLVDNLLRNAIEASPASGVVTVEIESTPSGATLAVRDQGQGVPEGQEGRLFEPFFTTRQEGTGLGLALSRAVAVAHGGTLGYTRERGTTVFRATFTHGREA